MPVSERSGTQTLCSYYYGKWNVVLCLWRCCICVYAFVSFLGLPASLSIFSQLWLCSGGGEEKKKECGSFLFFLEIHRSVDILRYRSYGKIFTLHHLYKIKSPTLPLCIWETVQQASNFESSILSLWSIFFWFLHKVLFWWWRLQTFTGGFIALIHLSIAWIWRPKDCSGKAFSPSHFFWTVVFAVVPCPICLHLFIFLLLYRQHTS